jgi:peptidoglycan/LPS O-acetylase OafA/YrhL
MKNKFEYQNYLDVLRLIAVLLVFLFHLNQDFFKFGFIGVDIFFVISGYVITQSLFNYKLLNNDISLIHFYSKRFLRLFPALIVMLILFVIFYLYFINWSDLQLKITIKSFFSSIFALSNFYFFFNLDQFDYFSVTDHSIPLLHTWSLSVEEQFYLFYPIILVLVFKLFKENKKFINIFFIFLLIIFLTSFLFFFSNTKFSHFYLPFGRIWEITLGCIIFTLTNTYVKKDINKFLVYLLITFSTLILILKLNYSFFTIEKLLILFAVITTLTVINFNKFIPKFILNHKTINILGRSSYSIYLYHMPIIFFSNYFFKGTSFYFFSILFTIIFSLISFKYIESVRNNIFILRNIQKSIKYFVFLVLVIFFINSFSEIKLRSIVYNFILITNNFVSTYKQNDNTISKRLLAKWELDNDKCIINDENFKRSTYLNCIKNDFQKNNLFFLIGDSYGEHFINTLAKTSSIKNLYYGRLDNENFSSKHNINNTFRIKNSYKILSKKFKKNTIIIISINYPSELNYNKTKTFLDKFNNNEKFIFISPHKVILNTKKCKTINKPLFINCEAKLDYIQNIKIHNILDKLKKTNNVFVYDFKSQFCNKKTCFNYLNKEDIFVFTDDFSHLTKEFAEFISNDFNKFLKKIVN